MSSIEERAAELKRRQAAGEHPGDLMADAFALAFEANQQAAADASYKRGLRDGKLWAVLILERAATIRNDSLDYRDDELRIRTLNTIAHQLRKAIG